MYIYINPPYIHMYTHAPPPTPNCQCRWYSYSLVATSLQCGYLPFLSHVCACLWKWRSSACAHKRTLTCACPAILYLECHSISISRVYCELNLAKTWPSFFQETTKRPRFSPASLRFPPESVVKKPRRVAFTTKERRLWYTTKERPLWYTTKERLYHKGKTIPQRSFLCGKRNARESESLVKKSGFPFWVSCQET